MWELIAMETSLPPLIEFSSSHSATHMVYPGALYFRGLELGIDYFDVQTVKLAGLLLHDVGRGPLSLV
ncbi:hypothetical protein GH714_010553 [Hevea brasiliensis]|uniref:HD domain-containing protein n=1 Tax=Hevea brasiliensis TaxID=3981 RepID=A0A6A6M7Q2_HEVBR|nr:hypothetical protein GH714_010553 [Hevea brasiliensis]